MSMEEEPHLFPPPTHTRTHTDLEPELSETLVKLNITHSMICVRLNRTGVSTGSYTLVSPVTKMFQSRIWHKDLLGSQTFLLAQ